MKFFPGRKLDYEPKYCEKHSSEQDFLTAVEFSAEDPYGKAVALLNLKSGFVKVQGFKDSFCNLKLYSNHSTLFEKLTLIRFFFSCLGKKIG